MLNIRKAIGRILGDLAKLLPDDDSFVERKELIWINPSPDADFSAQTISSSSAGWIAGKVLSNYADIEVIYRGGVGINEGMNQKCPLDVNHALIYVASITSSSTYARHYYRGCKPTNNGIDFGDAKYKPTNSNSPIADNGVIVPSKIYGIRRISGDELISYILNSIKLKNKKSVSMPLTIYENNWRYMKCLI